MFKVIREFKDKDGHIYNVGDDYPSVDAKKPTSARIKVLTTTNNEYGKIYVEKIEK